MIVFHGLSYRRGENTADVSSKANLSLVLMRSDSFRHCIGGCLIYELNPNTMCVLMYFIFIAFRYQMVQ